MTIVTNEKTILTLNSNIKEMTIKKESLSKELKILEQKSSFFNTYDLLKEDIKSLKLEKSNLQKEIINNKNVIDKELEEFEKKKYYYKTLETFKSEVFQNFSNNIKSFFKNYVFTIQTLSVFLIFILSLVLLNNTKDIINKHNYYKRFNINRKVLSINKDDRISVMKYYLEKSNKLLKTDKEVAYNCSLNSYLDNFYNKSKEDFDIFYDVNKNYSSKDIQILYNTLLKDLSNNKKLIKLYINRNKSLNKINLLEAKLEGKIDVFNNIDINILNNKNKSILNEISVEKKKVKQLNKKIEEYNYILK